MSRAQLRQEALRVREARRYRPSAQEGPSPISSIDVTLNALIQVIPWRLSVARAIVSLVDKDIQYIIAESTKTSDIEGLKGPLAPEDGLLLGCDGSLNRCDSLCQYAMATPAPSTGFPFFQIPDIGKEERFHHIPAVSQGGIRFYAGTPLITPEGLRVGTLCVLDTEPRPALNDEQVHFMGLMSKSVMQHLEMKTDMQQQRRFNKMTRGLTDLVTQDTPIFDHGDFDDDENDRNNQAPFTTFPGLTTSSPFEEPSQPKIHTASPIAESKTHRQTFMAAAETLRLSLDGDLALLAENFDDLRTWSTSADSRVGMSCSVSKQPHMQRILSFEHPEQIIQTISQRWPLGKIWVRDDNNNFVGLEDNRYRHLSMAQNGRRMSSHSADSQPDADECDWLASWLPTARQVVFVPLWDQSTVHTASACFVMSQQNLPVFSTQVEVPFIRAFLNSLSVICGQLTLQVADQQKDQLLSSISHELRSPLHGVIAAVEMLSTTNLDRSQADLCENIDVCSQTLLDTMSLVMDHAMVNSFVEGRSKNPFHKNAGPTVHAGSSLHLESTCNIAALCEEGIDITKSAFSSLNKVSGSALTSTEGRKPAALLEIDFRASRADWTFTCRPGVIRRLVMNLVSNSMKYTTSGSICCDLTQGDDGEITRDASHIPIVLTVIDTGRGMSSDFLKNGLFQPFSQESSAAPGLGLGLSIVRASVRSLQGTIDVNSKPGQGTRVTVSFLATRPSSSAAPASPKVDTLSDLKPCIIAPHKTYRVFGARLDESARHRQTLDVYLCDWWLFDVVHDTSALADFTFVCEMDAHLTLPPSKHYIILTDLPLAETMRNKRPCQPFTYLRAPFGPKSLSKALAAASGSRPSSNPTVATVNEVADPSTTTIAKPSSLSISSQDHPALAMDRAPIPPSPALSVSAILPTIQQMPPPAYSDPVNGVGTPSPTSPLHQRHPISKNILRRPNDYFTGATHAHSDSAVLTKAKLTPRKSSVLCVDDNAINLKLLQTYCAKLGFDRIATAMNGQEAVEAVKDTTLPTTRIGAPGGHPPYEVIFMDLTMPVCDGFEATRLIREFERRRRVLVMESPNLPDDRDEGPAGEVAAAATQGEDNAGSTVEGIVPPMSSVDMNGSTTPKHPADSQPATALTTSTKIPDPKELDLPESAAPRAIIIAITALASEADQKKAFAAGVDHFVTKPLRFKDLRVLLGELGVL